jgi:hypothetical protein
VAWTPDAWFPLQETAAAVEVLRTCAACSMRRTCLRLALSRPEVGIWAGTTTLERATARAALSLGIAAEKVLNPLLHTASARATEARHDWTPAEPVAS